MFSDSSDNPLFKIEYELHIFIKHQSKLEFGMGNSVTFPIEVKAEAYNLPWVSTKEQTWMMANSISDWAPILVQPVTHLHFEKNEEGQYKPVSTPTVAV